MDEDTTNSYMFAATKDKNFAYTIKQKDSKAEYYNGICRITASRDTIFLMYTNNKKPAFVRDYLVKEASGKGYIQYFTDGRKREFLFYRPSTGRGRSLNYL